MGARTNFIFKQSDTTFITLYSHWGGDSKMRDLAMALEAARPRWNDIGYGTRIMVSHLIGDAWTSETGYGLYADEFGGEEEYQSTIIDMTNKTVIVDEVPHSFEDFIYYNLTSMAVN
jgi:hypothetical protein